MRLLSRLFRRRTERAETNAPVPEPDGFRHAPDLQPEDVVMPPPDSMDGVRRRQAPTRGPITGLEGGGGSGPLDDGGG